MRILHVLAGDEHSGANRGALGLVALQRAAGWDVEVLNLRRLPGRFERAFALLQRRVNRLLQRLCAPRAYMNFFFPVPAPSPPSDAFDVVHVHWCAGQLSPNRLRRWRGKLVITLRDEWFFTGGCHYSLGCQGFQHGCLRCPLVGSSEAPGRWSPARALVARSARAKGRVFAALKPPVIAIGAALGEKAQQATVLKDRPVSVIPNYVTPLPEGALSEAPPRTSAYYLFVTTHLAVPHKGLDLLRGLSVPVVLLGSPEGVDQATFGGNFTFVGIGDDRAALAAWMRGAKALLVPSRGEAFGKVILEAFSVGTPVVALAVDEPARLVEPGVSGALVRSPTAEAFREAVDELEQLSPAAYAALREGARARFSALQNPEAILSAHEAIYRQVAHGQG